MSFRLDDQLDTDYAANRLNHIPGSKEVSCTLLLIMKLTDNSKEFIIPHLGVVQDILLYQLVLSRETMIDAVKVGY